MIIPKYRIADSLIKGAGQGVLLLEPVIKGKIVVFPDAIPKVYTLEQIRAFPKGSLEQESSARWFEDYYTITPEWTDECYINHSFTPSGIWHLGFIFAARDLSEGEELTIDYRFIIPEGEEMPFKDSASGLPIVGLSWKENMEKTLTLIGSMASHL
jgi:hypothetical protein